MGAEKSVIIFSLWEMSINTIWDVLGCLYYLGVLLAVCQVFHDIFPWNCSRTPQNPCITVKGSSFLGGGLRPWWFLGISCTCSLSRFLWMGEQRWQPCPLSSVLFSPLTLMPYAGLMRMNFFIFSRSPVKILKRTGPSTDPCCSSLVTGLQVVLSANLRAWQVLYLIVRSCTV